MKKMILFRKLSWSYEIMLGHFMNIYLNVSAVNPNSINKAFVFSILFSFLLKIVGK